MSAAGTVHAGDTYGVVVQRLRVGAVGELGGKLGKALVAMDGEVLLVVAAVVEDLLGLQRHC
jgi:hypothetical protein